jgi:hypothetical protein
MDLTSHFAGCHPKPEILVLEPDFRLTSRYAASSGLGIGIQ